MGVGWVIAECIIFCVLVDGPITGEREACKWPGEAYNKAEVYDGPEKTM